MRKTIKLVGILLLTLICMLTVGCEIGGEDGPVENKIAPTELEIYVVDAKAQSTYYYGDEIQLAVDVEPYNASYDVTWTSSDDSIATVDDNGKVKVVGTGDFTITATSKLDTSVSIGWTKKGYDNRNDLEQIDEAKAYLDFLIPTGYAVDGPLHLPNSYGSTTITWTSSNTSVITNEGIYSRQAEDVTVTLKARISCGRSLEEWERDVFVGNINDMQMKPLVTGKIVMMYAYSGMHKYTDYELENVDIINHAFALINSSTYKLNLSDVERVANDILKARSYGVRVCLSIGGWGADGFSQACRSDENRATFIASIIEAVEKYGYDGVDLDWEYPGSGSAGIAYLTKDKQNFTSLVKELREALNKVRPGLLLTAAVASGTSYYDIKSVDPYLDYWNLMTYDWSYKSSGSKARYDESLPDTKSSVESYIRGGATASKIVVGVTFRATKFEVDSLGSTYGIGEVMKSNRVDVDYKDLVKNYFNNSDYQFYYDSTNGMAVCYTTRKVNGSYIVLAYNNLQGMKAKGDLVKTKGLAGMMAWDLSMDSTNNEVLKMVVGAIR